jgi:hypothetical protein
VRAPALLGILGTATAALAIAGFTATASGTPDVVVHYSTPDEGLTAEELMEALERGDTILPGGPLGIDKDGNIVPP